MSASTSQNRFSSYLSTNHHISTTTTTPSTPYYPSIEPLSTFHPSSLDRITNAEKRSQRQQRRQRQLATTSKSTTKTTLYPHVKTRDIPNEITQIRLLIQKHETFKPLPGVKQPQLQQQLNLSLSYLVKALQLLKGDEKQYAVIIFDISKRIWNASRDTARQGARKWILDVWRETLSSLEQVLQQCGGSVKMREWVIQCGIQYILALDDAQQSDQAQKEFSRINDLVSGKASGKGAASGGKGAPAASSTTIQLSQKLLDDVFRLQLHISRNAKKGSGASAKDPNQKYLQSIQNAKSKMFDDDAKMQKELEDVCTALEKELLPDASASEQRPTSVLLKNAPQDKLLILSELALTAAHYSWDTLANRALKLTSATDDPHTTILSDYARADLLVKEMAPQKREKLTTDMVQTRLRAIALVEKGILNSRNLDPQYSGDAMLQGCILMWNLCLPLLNPNLRKHVYKPLFQAAAALEEMDAHNINELRSKILLELANCNIADDVLTKASNHVKKALDLDYVTAQENVDLYGMLRPLDRYLLPIKQQLDLKVDIYKVPETKEDESYLLIEQAREAKDVNLRKNLLERAYACLESGADTNGDTNGQDSADANNNDNTIDRLMRLKEKFNLYALCVKMAWVGNFKIVSVAREVAERIFSPDSEWNQVEWDIQRDREIFIDRALIHLIVAESYIVSLQQEDLELHTICDEDDVEGEALISNAESLLLKHIGQALDIGVESKQMWIVENCCVYLWNYHLPFFQDRQEFAQFVDILQKAFESLQKVAGLDAEAAQSGAKAKGKAGKSKGADKKASRADSDIPPLDTVILVRITFAYINALMQQFALEKSSTSTKDQEESGEDKKSSEVNYIDLMQNLYTHASSANGNNEQLKRALQVAEFTISQQKNNPIAAKDIIYLRAKLQKLTTDKIPSVLASKELNEVERLLTYIETLRQPMQDAEKLKTIQDASSAILSYATDQPPLHPQLYCWISYHALQLGQNKLAIQVAEKCFSNLPQEAMESAGKKKLGHITIRMWRWYALTTLNEVQGILQFVDPKSQNQTTQLNLRRQALQKLVHSMRFANFSQDVRVGVLVGNICVTCVSELMAQAAVRRNIQPQLLSILKDSLFITPEDGASANMLEKIYTFALRCIRDTSDFNVGLKLIKTALKHLPASHHKNLWQFDVEFRSKSGKADVKSSINRVSGYDVEMQANVFAMVGHYSSDFALQRESFAKAINILADKPFVQVNYMIQYAVWMYIHDLPLQEVTDLLMNSADILNDADVSDAGDGDYYDNASDAGSLVSSRSARSTLSRRSRTSQRTKRSRKSSRLSRVGSSSRMTGKTTRGGTTTKQEENQPSGPLSVAQLDSLCTIYILLSMTAENAEERLDYALTAHFFYMRILKTAFDFANGYNMKAAESKIRHDKDITSEENVPSVSYHQLPNTLEDWFNYDIPEAVREVWKKQKQEDSLLRSMSRDSVRPTTAQKQEQDLQHFLSHNVRYSLQSQNFTHLDQSLYFLNELYEYLHKEGYYAHCVPILNVKQVLGEGLSHPEDHTRLVQLEFSQLFEKLGIKELKQKFRSTAGNLKILPHVIRLQQEEHQLLQSERDQQQQKSEDTTQSSQQLRFRESVMGSTELRHIWVAQAKCLVESFELSLAHHLLEHALRDAQAHEDLHTRDECHLLFSQVFMMQGNLQQAIQSSSLARNGTNDMSFVLKCLHVSIEALYSSNARRIADALIKDASGAFQSVCQGNGQESEQNGQSEAQIRLAEFEHMVARVLIAHDAHHDKSIALLRSSLERMNQYNTKSKAFVQISLDYAKFLLENSFYKQEGVIETDMAQVEESLTTAIGVLEKTKIWAQNLSAEMIPPGSHLSDRYVCSQLLAETLIHLGRALSLLSEVQYQIEVERQIAEQKSLMKNVQFPKMATMRDDDTGKTVRRQIDEEEHGAEDNKDALHEATLKFMTQSTSPKLDDSKVKKAQLEKSMTLFSTAANLTCSPLLKAESHLYVGQCMRKVQMLQNNGKATSPNMLLLTSQSNLEKAFHVALQSENWHLLARVALELSMSQDEKLASKYVAFAQSMFASAELLNQFKNFSRFDQMETIFINLFERMRKSLSNPEQNEVYTRVLQRLKQQSIVFQTLTPDALVASAEAEGTTPETEGDESAVPISSSLIVKKITEKWPSSASTEESFVNLVLMLPPPPPSVIASIKPVVHACVLLNEEAAAVDSKQAKSSKKGKSSKEDIPPEEQEAAPTQFTNKQEIDMDALQELIGDYAHWKRQLSTRNVDTLEMEKQYQQIVQRTRDLLDPIVTPLKETLLYYSKRPNSRLVITADSLLSSLPLEILSNDYNAVSRDYSSLMIGARIRSSNVSGSQEANWNQISFIVDPDNGDEQLDKDFEALREQLTEQKVQFSGILGSEFKTRSERPQIVHIQQQLSRSAAEGIQTEAKPKKGADPAAPSTSKGVLLYAGRNLLDMMKGTSNLASLRLPGLNTVLVVDKKDGDSDYTLSKDVSNILSLRGVACVLQNEYVSLNHVEVAKDVESEQDEQDGQEEGEEQDDTDEMMRSVLQDVHHQLPGYILNRMATNQNQGATATVASVVTELRKQSGNHFAACGIIVTGLP